MCSTVDTPVNVLYIKHLRGIGESWPGKSVYITSLVRRLDNGSLHRRKHGWLESTGLTAGASCLLPTLQAILTDEKCQIR